MFVLEKTITEGGTLAAPLGFNALSVMIANPTGQYLHLIDTNIYVLPGQSNAVFNLPSGATPDMAQAEWAAPPGTTQPAGTAGQQAVLTYYDAWLPPSPGIIVQVTASVAGTVSVGNQPTVAGINSTVNTNSPQLPLPTVSDSTGAGTTSTEGTSNGAQAIAVQIADTSKIAHLKVAGHTSGVTYLELFFFAQSVYAFPYLAAIDFAVDITVQSIANGTTATVRPVQLLESVPEFLQIFPQPQLAPNQPPLALEAIACNQNATAALIAPAANIQLTVFEYGLLTTLANSSEYRLWQGTVATPKTTQITHLSCYPITSSVVPIDLKGAQLARGNGLFIENLSAASTFNGHVIYSKG